MKVLRIMKEKVLFELASEDGYPPVAVEGLWARKVNEEYVIDNIPFYVYGIGPGDRIRTKTTEGKIWFDALAANSGVSVFRIFVKNISDISLVRSALLDLSCPSEVDEKMGLIAVEIPVGVDITVFLDFAMNGQQSGQFDFEEGVLRHSLPE
jgi:hypothetical protein